jgi:hypothetical protein
MNDKELVATLKKIVKSAGYPFWGAYNDKHKDGSRRLKLMINGYDYGDRRYREWERKIRDGIRKAGIVRRIASFGFISCMTYRGPYWALAININPPK